MLEPGGILRSVGVHGEEGTFGYMYWCPGCRGPHHVPVRQSAALPQGPVWAWNGSTEKPTFSPSILLSDERGTKCHVFVRDGVIQFLGDCAHGLANQTVPIPPWPSDDEEQA